MQLNPELSEIWYNLGILYECCNQITDAVDAYTTAAGVCGSSVLRGGSMQLSPRAEYLSARRH